jgi:methyltransferase-like protein
MNNPQSTSYDALPYESFAFPATHPDRLAVIGTLFGMAPQALPKCRVLEIGCASGGNLLPMAMEMPDSEFVGIDLSTRQIQDGQSLVQSLGLTNISLRAADVMDIDRSIGEFDYIIVHGVFSWVPEPVQARLLDLCRDLLRPQGIAYISYNTYPGWHFREIVREAMLFHTAQFDNPLDKIAQGRGMVNFLAQSVKDGASAYGIVLRTELALLNQGRDSYVFHEYLESSNSPMYFHEFDRRVHASGLQYLGDVNLPTMFAAEFPPAVQETLGKIAGDIVRTEQYLDFLRNRSFRQTLLCHDGVPLQRTLDTEAVKQLFFSARLQEIPRPDFHSGQPEAFRTPGGAIAHTAHPMTKAALYHLARIWPQNISFPKLVDAARALVQTNDSAAGAEDVLAADLLTLATTGLVKLRARKLRLLAEVSDRPIASPLARELARRGNSVTSQKHEHIRLDDFGRHLITLLDGTRTQGELADIVVQRFADGAFQLPAGVEGGSEQLAKFVDQLLVETLPRFAESALLIG